MNSDPKESSASARRRQRRAALARGAALAAVGLLGAGAAHAGTADLTDLTLRGILAYFADPANVRGMFGAAAGALISILAARPFAGSAEDSDDR